MKKIKQLIKNLRLETINLKFAFIALFLLSVLSAPEKTFAEILFSDDFNVTISGDVNTEAEL